MARPRSGIRLIYEHSRTRKNGSVEAATYTIRDSDGDQRIRLGTADELIAQRALEDYIARKRLAADKERRRTPEELLVSEVLTAYCDLKTDPQDQRNQVADPHELLRRTERLLRFWGEKKVVDIKGSTCRQYAKEHTSETSARRELQDLQAALYSAAREGMIFKEQLPTVTLPPAAERREELYERDDIARMLWTAWRRKKRFTFSEKRSRAGVVGKVIDTKSRPSRHLTRFILVALYTGSRSGRIWTASFVHESGRPWIDLDSGVYYRTPLGGTAPENKRAPPIKLPPRLLAHMRRWHRNGQRYVIEHNGKPANPRKAMSRLIDGVLGDDSKGVVHTFRHTAATWLMRDTDVPVFDLAGFLGMSVETLIKHYGHHRLDHHDPIGKAFNRAGKKQKTVIEKAV